MQRISYLYERYQTNTLSVSEFEELKALASTSDYQEQFRPIFEAIWEQSKADGLYHIPNHVEQRMYNSILGRSNTKIFKMWPRIAAAIVILLTVGTGVLVYTNKMKKISPSVATLNDVAPATVGATLTLANGKQIILSGVKKGKITAEGGLEISKTEDGQIVYQMKAQDKGDNNNVNILSTARGETYQVRLSDGSLVVLNADSRLTYSTSLNEHGERRVVLDGEAYFEITKDKKHPFIVESEEQEVQVLGTHFNVNTYKDDQTVQTTLLEGSININKNTILRPGQQALLNNQQIEVRNIDPETAIAWKRGKFVFINEQLQTIMKKIARWYNVEVQFQDANVAKETFWGTISSFKNVSDVLKMLELTKKVHFKIEGRRIMVRK